MREGGEIMEKAKRVVIIAFPKGGFAVGPEDCGEWSMVTESLDKALAFARKELAPPPQILTSAELRALARHYNNTGSKAWMG